MTAKVNLSDPCIFTLVQSSEHPTLKIEYDQAKHQKNNSANEIKKKNRCK